MLFKRRKLDNNNLYNSLKTMLIIGNEQAYEQSYMQYIGKKNEGLQSPQCILAFREVLLELVRPQCKKYVVTYMDWLWSRALSTNKE